MKIALNNQIKIDLPKLIDSRLLLQANSGGGKSWAIRKIIEESFGKVQIIVLDPEGEFPNMRDKFDFVIAGKDADAPVEVRSAALLARKLLETNASAIVDLYELKPQDRKHFVKLFLDSMVNAPKELWHDCLVIIDEAHIFAPEKGESEALGSVIDLATRGRKRGYCVVLATQRLSKLNKDAAAECNNKLIGRASQDIDMKRAADELGFTSREQMFSLRQLEPGEFYAFGTAISTEVIRTTIGDVQVKPPPRGQSKRNPPPPTARVKQLLAKLGDIPKEAETELRTVKDLKGEIARLTVELKRKPVEKVEMKVSDPAAIERAVKAAQKKKDEEWGKVVKGWKSFASRMMAGIELFKQMDISKIPADTPIITQENIQEKPLVKPVFVSSKPHVNPNIQEESHNDDSSPLGICAKTIYSFLHDNQGKDFSKVQLGAVTGYSPKSSSFQNAMSRLNTMGLIHRKGSRIEFGELSEENLIESEEYSPTLWFSKLGKCPKEIYELVWENPDEAFTKEEIGERTNYSPSSSSFQNALSKLNSLGLIVREGGNIRLNPELLNI